MGRKPVTRGRCYNCKKEFGKIAIKRHLMKCNNGGEGDTGYFLLKVEGYYNKDYWLYIQIKEVATLKDLDLFLRDIWVECCGHLSSFTIDDVSYDDGIDGEFGFFADREVREMGETKLKDILGVGLAFKYEYDFGSTTTLKLTVMEEYKAPRTDKAITLLARNNAPEHICEKCDEKATYAILDYDYETDLYFCDSCIDEYDDEDDGIYVYPIVNSPRMGVCGYGAGGDAYELEE